MSVGDKNYTPVELADKLVETAMTSLFDSLTWAGGWNSEQKLKLKILDPAMGTGNILNSVKRYIYNRYTNDKVSDECREGILNHISERMLYGVEIDPGECEKAKQKLNLKNAVCADYLSVKTYDCGFVYPFDFDFTDKVPVVDLIIGNPPFLGGGKISSVYGSEYAKAIRKGYSMPGRADYCAYFLRKAHMHMSGFGHISYIVTNTISQGATRKGGLQWMLAHGWEVYNADKNVKWPGDAKVTVSIIHLRRKNPNFNWVSYLYGNNRVED